MKCFKTILFVLICTSFFGGCKNSKSISVNSSEIKSTPEIIFLNYNIEEEDVNTRRTIQFLNKKIVNGKLKNKLPLPIENGISGDLILTELDKKSKKVNQILIKNPLIKHIEYVNESKNFKTKTVKLDKTQFSIRLQLKSNTKYITISNFTKNEPLIKTHIK